jgi:hypothetical protein
MKKWMLIGLMILVWSNLANGKSVSPRRAYPLKKASPAQTAVEKQERCKAYIVVEATTGKVGEGRKRGFAAFGYDPRLDRGRQNGR